MQVIAGRAWVFGDSISTEYMMPGFTMLAKMPDDEAKRHCMGAIRPGFHEIVRPGDIMVAGRNCGCGSSRLAFRLLKALGISCVVADAFAGLFFRNGINGGLPLIECPGITSEVGDGDTCRIDLAQGIITNLTRNRSRSFAPLGGNVLKILEAGGIIPLLKAQMKAGTAYESSRAAS